MSYNFFMQKEAERSFHPIIVGSFNFDGRSVEISGTRIDGLNSEGLFEPYTLVFEPTDDDTSDIPVQWPASKDGVQASIIFLSADSCKPMIQGVCFVGKDKKPQYFKAEFTSPF
jgi:hypothetical protein